MSGSVPDAAGIAGTPAGPDSPRLPPVPSPRGRQVLAFVFLVLLEYWVAPPLLGITNYAGLWSDAGVVLFVVLVAALGFFVLWPLRLHLRVALRRPRNRVVFHALWASSFAVGLYVVNLVQFTTGPASPPVLLDVSTVYSPFGAWPTLDVWVPALQMWSTWNVEGPAILFLLSWLTAASVVLGPLSPPRACPRPTAEPLPGWRRRLAAAGVLAPLGFVSGCPGCAPVYFALLSGVAPATADGAMASLPLVPFIGFAGLLYLAGFVLAVHLLRRSTTVEPTDDPVPVEG